ncbi:YheC/YheD family protein [Alteribacillus sp. YIM 98480]|uniref:YheC/YheD family protein n=1 Tax=Alteribacillus sp. YIM 98480 TaxID=2606599 RepID=UPI002107DA2A|nr:YheC/YheD family protein [Alteribacillus sp. YIM 98480]
MGKYYQSPFLFGGKLGMYKTLYKAPILKKYLPITKKFTYKNLIEMTKKYSTVYIKPQKSSKGRGIYRIKPLKNKYECRSTKRTKTFKKLLHLYQYIVNKSKKKKKRIIQQGIALDQVKGRPYDIRALVQKKPNGKWVFTGMNSRVGKKNKIVTNLSRGGQINLVGDLFKKLGIPRSEQRRRYKELKRTALNTAKFLSFKKPNIHVLGIDFAYDKKGNLWILEINSRPQYRMLKKVAPSMYKRMRKYARNYRKVQE